MSDGNEAAFTLADEVAFKAIECGIALEPWQFRILPHFFPDAEPARTEREDNS